MKKQLLLLTSFCLILFGSCSEDELLIEDDYRLSSPVIQLENIYYSDGSEDEIMDKAIIEITNVYESELLNPSNFERYKSLFKEYYEVHLSRVLDTSLIDELKSFESDLLVRERQYNACLMIPNIAVADFSLNPIIAPGVEVDYLDENLVGDVIVGWYYTEKGERQHIFIDEKLAISSKRPIFIITNDDQTEAKIEEDVKMTSSKKSVTSTLETYAELFPAIDDLMIENRYESTGKSDVFLAFKATDHVYGWYGGTFHSHLADIHKDYLGYYVDVQYTNASTLYYYHDAHALAKIYMVSYEKDPLRSFKDVSFPDNVLISNMCRIKNSGDTYVKTYARYDEDGDLVELYDSQGFILVESDDGGLIFHWLD